MFCTNCGKELPVGSLVCTHCGQTTNIADDLKSDNEDLYQELIGKEYDDKLKAPLTTAEFILVKLILLIPILNIVMLFIWAFGKDTNLNKKAFARAKLVFWAIWLVIIILMSMCVSYSFYLWYIYSIFKNI